ncbi:MAG: N-acetylmuramoyl-L-alanine amidase [Candidatus Taylorbacteria bacterium]
MFSSTRAYFVVVLCLFIFAAPWIATNYPNQVDRLAGTFENIVMGAASQAATVIFHNPRTITELQTKYTSTTLAMSGRSALVPELQPKVRILLVPGHEPGIGGTEFGALKERNMNVELTNDLAKILETDSHFQVFTTRDDDSWNQTLSAYFKDNWAAIKTWQKDSHNEMKHLISIGSSTLPVSKVIHNKVPTNIALRLYGITKWANENAIDVVIHIHFNDIPNHKANVPGKNKGFAIYVPVGQYANSTTTKAVANAVSNRLEKDFSISNLPGESSGIVDEPDLIAIGANNTADAASMLIEYGYIYEPQFQTTTKREEAFRTMANDTYLGLLDFFSGDVRITPRYF